MRKKILYVVLTLMAIIPFISVKALDFDEYFNSKETVSSSESIDHSYFIAGNKITSNDDVKGILFMAGNALKSKRYSEYGFMAGNVIEVTGTIEKDLFIAGNDITIEEGALIGRDLYVAGNTLTINSNVEGNIFVTSSMIEFNNVILKGDITLDCNDIIFGDDVIIEGNLKYNEDANIEGLPDEFDRFETYKSEETKKVSFIQSLKSKLFSAISLIIISFLLVSIFPKIYKRLSKENTINSTLKRILEGFCILIGIPIAAILIMITVVGIPISIISLLLYGIFIYLSFAASGIVVGNIILTKLFKAEDNMYLSILIGIFILKLLSLIPYIGGIIGFLVLLIGLGLIFQLLKNKTK